MVRKKYTEEQIFAVCKEAEAAAKLPELCRKYGMSDAPSYVLPYIWAHFWPRQMFGLLSFWYH